MKVILDKDLKKLGFRGDVVKVRPGYFRNFLLPRGIAQLATERLIVIAEERKKKSVVRKEQILENAKEILKKLKKLEVTIKAKVSSKGKLFGSIKEEDVLAAIKSEAKVELTPEYLKMDHIKELGKHKVKVVFGEDLEAEVTVIVEKA